MRQLLPLFVCILFFCNTMNTQAQTAYKTVEGYTACVSKKYINDMIAYSNQKDYDAIQVLLDAGVCLVIAEGITVYLMDSSWGVVEIRPKGMTDTVWTVREAIKQ